MESDLQDNGIQQEDPVPEVDDNVDPLAGVADDVGELVTPVQSPADLDSDTEMTSYFSSASSTNNASELFSKETLSLSQPVITNGDESKTMSPLTDVPKELSVPAITGFFSSGDIGDIIDRFESVRNSTTSFLEQSNETVLQSSSWSPEEIGAVVIVSIMVPFILLSNIFVIISIIRFRRLHTPTNYFITSLAAVDIFVALATPFGIVVEVFNFDGAVEPGDVVICLLPNRILMMACGVSVLTLATIAYDRHTALVSPLEYINIMTSRKVAILVSLTWIYAAFIVWLPLMAGWYNLPSEAAPCSANLIHGKAPVLFLGAIFVPSCVAIFICYFRIFMVARHHAKAIAAVEFAVHRHLQVKFMIKDTKYAKTLALVIGVFLLLWLPYLTFVFIQAVSSKRFNVWVQTYLILLTVFNSGINPWVYAFKNNELRAAFKRLFRELCRHKLCDSVDRRASLVSAVSGTPRLSRTDSRIASIPEVTVCTINEKLKKSLDSLDDETNDKHEIFGHRQRRQTVTGELSSAHACLKPSLRQAASCSNLDTVKGGEEDMVESSTRGRSHSVDFTLTNEASGENEADFYDLNDLFYQSHDKEFTRQRGSRTSVNENNDYNNEQIIRTQSSPLSSSPLSSSPLSSSPLSSNSLGTSTPLKVSLSLSPVYLQPPPSPSYGFSSKSNSHESAYLTNHSSQPPQHQPTPHTTSSSTSHTLTPPHQQLRYTHSFDYLNDAMFPATSWKNDYCQEIHTNTAFHPYFQNPQILLHSASFSDPMTAQPHDQQHTLTHTNSCPIFEPITSYQSLFPQTWDDDIKHSHLRKMTSTRPENCLDFVSLVNREAELSCIDRYLV